MRTRLLVAALLLLLGVVAVTTSGITRTPGEAAAAVRVPAPPPVGEHGEVRFEATSGQGAVEHRLTLDPTGRFRAAAADGGAAEVVRTGTLDGRRRAAVVDAVQRVCRTKLRPRYEPNGYDLPYATVTVGGLTVVTSYEGPDELLALLRLLDALGRELTGAPG